MLDFQWLFHRHLDQGDSLFMMRFRCLLPLGLVLVLSCNITGGLTDSRTDSEIALAGACSDTQLPVDGVCTAQSKQNCNPKSSTDVCASQQTCQVSGASGKCQPETAQKCKQGFVCGTTQVCINGVCGANVCKTQSDCTNTSHICFNGQCTQQSASAGCKTHAACIENANTNNTACIPVSGSYGFCGCNTNADCSASLVCNANRCVKASCTQNLDCSMNQGQICAVATGKCITQTCTADSECPGNSVCSNYSCTAQTSAHCIVANNTCATTLPGSLCTAGTAPALPTCVPKTCTASKDCDASLGSNLACISGTCQINACTGSGAGNCTDTTQTCQSGRCNAQSGTNCRAGATGVCANSAICNAQGVCPCGKDSDCLVNGTQDMCTSGVCVAQTATHCIPDSLFTAAKSFCSKSVLANTTCNTLGQCICGVQTGATSCTGGQICNLDPANAGQGTCGNPPRYVFLTQRAYTPGTGTFSSVKDGDAICQAEATKNYGFGNDSWVAMLGALSDSDAPNASAYQHLLSVGGTVDNKRNVILAGSGVPGKMVSLGIPTSATPSCPTSPGTANFDCITQWTNIPSVRFWGAFAGTPANIYLAIPVGGITTNCLGWSSNQSTFYGAQANPNDSWSYSNSMSCSTSASFLCVQADNQ